MQKFLIFEKALDFLFRTRNCSNKLSFETTFVKIEHVYWQETKIKKKLMSKYTFFFAKISSFFFNLIFFLNIRSSSNKLSFQSSFVKIEHICWQKKKS